MDSKHFFHTGTAHQRKCKSAIAEKCAFSYAASRGDVPSQDDALHDIGARTAKALVGHFIVSLRGIVGRFMSPVLHGTLSLLQEMFSSCLVFLLG